RRRREIAEGYRRRLLARAGLVLPPMELPDGTISWFVYPLRLREGTTQEQRDEVFRAMKARGIGCGRYFRPIHLLPAYRSGGSPHLPVTVACASRMLALPFFNAIREA